MPDINESPLVQAVKSRKTPISESEKLLEMILMQVTKMADSLEAVQSKETPRIVTTQQSHAP